MWHEKKNCLSLNPPGPCGGHRSFKMKLDGRHLSLRDETASKRDLRPAFEMEIRVSAVEVHYLTDLSSKASNIMYIRWTDMARAAF